MSTKPLAGAAALLAVVAALLLAPPAGARWRPPVPAPIYQAVRAYWKVPAKREEAFDVIWCESRYSTRAKNGQYLGLFQMGTDERRKYGHGSTPMAQAAAAHRYFLKADGWGPWGCKP